MWHTAEMVKIFEKMTEGYGYDIYQNRKLCVALCNDLFADYSVEKNIMQMLFRAGLGEAMKGVPFKSERELKMGLSNIEKFLMAQAIESSVRDDVLDVMRLAFVEKGVNVAHDEMWNLNPTTKSINSSKSNNLPDWDTYFKKLAQQEYHSYQLMWKNDIVHKEFEKCAKEHINSDDIRYRVYRRGLEYKTYSNRQIELPIAI